MKYKMQILTRNKNGTLEIWSDVKPTNGTAYEYETKEEAQRMLEMCYPDVENMKKRVIGIY